MLNLGDSKTGPRTIYLNSRARELIERQPRFGPCVFPCQDDPMRPMAESSSLRVWYLVRRRAGIEDVRLHDLRHNFASPRRHAGRSAPDGGEVAWSPSGVDDPSVRTRCE